MTPDDHLGLPCRGEEIDCAWCGRHHTLDSVCQCACCQHPDQHDPVCPEHCPCTGASQHLTPCGRADCLTGKTYVAGAA